MWVGNSLNRFVGELANGVCDDFFATGLDEVGRSLVV